MAVDRGTETAPPRFTLGGWLLAGLGLLLAVATPVLSTLASGQFHWRNVWFWALVVTAGGTWVTGRLSTRQAQRR